MNVYKIVMSAVVSGLLLGASTAMAADAPKGKQASQQVSGANTFNRLLKKPAQKKAARANAIADASILVVMGSLPLPCCGADERSDPTRPVRHWNRTG